MASYGAKNMHFEGCSLSRFDAHDGFWNANLIDCEFGRYINVVGGGYLYIKDTERKSGQAYIDLRSDYGSSFRGDITVINGTIEGQKSYRGPNDEQRLYNYETLYLIRTSYQDKYQGAYEEGNAGAAPFLKWDFGYTCYMPQNVVIDNFSVMTEATVYLYQSVGDNAFIKPKDFVQDSDWKGKSVLLPDGSTRPMTEDDIYYNQYQITKSVVYKNMLPLPPCEDNSLHLYKHLSSVTRVE